MRYLLPLLCTAALVMAATGDQDPSQPIKVEVNLVNATFTVRNSNGQLAGDLKAEDFEIFEDGVAQQIRFFGRSADLPLRLALAVDGSGSQQKFNRDHHKDVERFLNAALAHQDEALLLGFGNRLRLACDFTADVSALMDGLTRYEKGKGSMPELDPDDTRSGGTALFDAVVAIASDKLAPISGGRKAIIILSDGEDNSSAHDVVNAIEAAQSADSLIYTIRYTETRKGRLSARNRYGITEMERMARETGGTAFDASKAGVAESLAAISEELRALYDIGYTTTSTEHNGSFRKIVIRAKKPGLVVRAKSGYYPK